MRGVGIEYRPRIVDKILLQMLRSAGAVVIEGPRWCGKTTTALQIAGSVEYIDSHDDMAESIVASEIYRDRILKGETPRLIDEWQSAPFIWDAVRREVDRRGSPGQYILTGSVTPPKEGIVHSGTGRFAWLTMRPMSLFESGDSTGEVCLNGLFNNPSKVEGQCQIDAPRLAFLICRGGWPMAIDYDEDVALEAAYNYYDAVVKSDAILADGVRRNPERLKKLMRSYARNQGMQVSNASIGKDIGNGEVLDSDTVASYIGVLKRIFVIEESEAWNPNLRSKTAIRSSSTRYFVDPSIAIAALNLGPGDLLADLSTMGLMFETLCIRDLRVYSEAIGGSVYHYRDHNDLECDAVIHLRNGRYALVEVKLGGITLINAGAENLKKLASKLDTERMGTPAFLMVLVGIGEYAYRRDDGVLVVPIGCLRD